MKVFSLTAASDTLTVSGTAGGVADGTYPRGLGVNAFDAQNNPQWLKVGGAGTDDAIRTSDAGGGDFFLSIFVGGSDVIYASVFNIAEPWQITPSQWLLTADDSPNAATVGVGGTPVLDPQAVVVGVDNTTGLGTAAGTTGANGTYPKVSDTLWAIVGGAGTAADGIEWDGVDTYDLKVGNVAKYEGTGGTLAGGPQSATWAAVGGAGTVPTVTQGYSTAQALLDRLEEEKADVADLPLRYKFTGDGGAATGTIGVNTYPMAVTVTNPGTGQYRFTAASGTPWTLGKTYVSVAVIDGSASLGWIVTELSTSTVYIRIFDTTSGTDADPSGYLITIETEP